MENLTRSTTRGVTPSAISEFLVSNIGYDADYGYGYGAGYGTGTGKGVGYGKGYGAGAGYGASNGIGYGASNGIGYGAGDGYGYGTGTGKGVGYGDSLDCDGGAGSGSGYGAGIKCFCGDPVNIIDGVETIIDHIHDNTAKGKVLNGDLTTRPCYVVKRDGYFAHGDTLKEAVAAVLEKVFEDMPAEKRIAAFVEAHDKDRAYPNTDYFHWHNKLTGSCRMGREAFARDQGIDMDGSMTVAEFIRLTENAYGGETIRQLKKYYEAESPAIR